MRRALLLTTPCLALLLAFAAQSDLTIDFDEAGDPLAAVLAKHPKNAIVEGGGVDGSSGLRTTYVGGEMGSERVVIQPRLDAPLREATLSFDVRFDENFQFVRGGKLHGLGPTRPTSGGNPTKPEGWSVRLVWRSEGGLQTYVYDQRKTGKYGVVKPAEGFRFEPGRWYHLDLHVRVNEDPEAATGFAHVWVDGKKLIEHDDLQLRAEGGDETLITRLLYSTFHGGNGPEWAPKNADGSFATVHANFDNFRIAAGGPPTTRPRPR